MKTEDKELGIKGDTFSYSVIANSQLVTFEVKYADLAKFPQKMKD
jgi:hypothetical protein